VTDKDGDKVITVYQGKGTAPGIIAGDFQWTGGTGKVSGIQGNNAFHVTAIGKNPASWIVWEGEWRLPYREESHAYLDYLTDYRYRSSCRRRREPGTNPDRIHRD
jgi:hypothetical protein